MKVFTLFKCIVPGMALAPWNVLAGGKLRTDAEEQRRRESNEQRRTFLSADWERTEDETKMSRALEKVAAEVGVQSITAGQPIINFAFVTQSDIFTLHDSGHRLPPPKDPVCLSHHWWSQGRTPPRQYRSPQHQPHD